MKVIIPELKITDNKEPLYSNDRWLIVRAWIIDTQKNIVLPFSLLENQDVRRFCFYVFNHWGHGEGALIHLPVILEAPRGQGLWLPHTPSPDPALQWRVNV